MSVPIDSDLVLALIRQRFGSVDNFAAAWEKRDRSTIFRWLRSGIPSSKEVFFSLSALLDVDPVALLAIDALTITQRFMHEQRLFQLGNAGATHYSPLWDLYLNVVDWPNQTLAVTHYQRPWVTQDFAHDPKLVANVYASLLFENTENDMPRTYHFAWRRSGVGRIWQPYGVLVARADRVVLVSANGDFQEKPRKPGRNVCAGTYFGAGPAQFRVASLHSFALHVELGPVGDNCVRFEA